MPSVVLKLQGEWNSENSYTSAEDKDVLVTNTDTSTVVFEITTDNTLPVIDLSRAHTLQSKQTIALSLKANEYLWFATKESNGWVTYLAV